jgi:starch phosphorylase
MRPVSTFVVTPTLPERLAPLKELAYNFWWCWNRRAIDLFRRIDRTLWEDLHHNPVALLNRVSHAKLAELADRVEYVNQVNEVHAEFRAYMTDRGWYSTIDPQPGTYIAYFCAEFGIHESFSNYSGGLGVLAGDHLKSSSDLGLPLVAVGLLYQEGYFRQYLTQNGWQNEQYNEIDFYSLPLTQMMSQDGTPLSVTVDVPTGTIHANIWRTNVGRVPLYLLDTNVPENANIVHRDTTDRLYGGTVHDRIRQEMVLGIGGMRALTALGIVPAAIHVNEGHAGYALLERTRNLMHTYGISFREALRINAASGVFTTHTPVPAGNEVFHYEVLAPYLKPYVETLGITWEEFQKLGSAQEIEEEVGFSMTILGLKGASHRNGVSELHGEVARTMWKDVWPHVDQDEVPITAVTNGVHTRTWVASEIAELYDRYLPPTWRTHPEEPEAWEGVEAIPSVELWRAHERRRELLVLAAREHVLRKHTISLTAEQISRMHDFLDPDVLTIGFARRFATYKRADLFTRDMERLVRMVTSTERPMQFVIAGKAHPNDGAGKEMIQRVLHVVRDHGIEHRIVFLEDYDMHIARKMVRGCDVWLNTPRRPHEASGTSGMKAVLNGAIHCSILDGWWAEAYNGSNGFAIGRGEELMDELEQDAADSETLYDLLEHSIAPTFYDRQRARVPDAWIALMKRSISTLAWRFSASRMVRDYAVGSYTDATRRYVNMTADHAAPARSMEASMQRLTAAWPGVSIPSVVMHGTHGAHVGKSIHISASVQLAGIDPLDVSVEALHGRIDSRGQISPARVSTLTPQRVEHGVTIFEGSYECTESGMQGCTVRVMATNPHLVHPVDSQLTTYAS